jgi:hypothetical protein
MADLMNKLKPYVSVFSAAVPLQCKHGDTVTVGGKVTGIVNMKELLKNALDDEFKNEGVYLTLDDEIGEVQVCIGPKAYEIFEAKYGEVKVGDVLLAGGRVHVLDTTHSYEGARGKTVTVDMHKDETIRILAYQIAPLPDEQPKKILEPKE